MKEVLAVVRMDKVSVTKNALSEAGIPGFTCRKVMGRGKKVVHRVLYHTIAEEGEMPLSPVGEYMTEGTRLIPKRMFTIILKDQDVEKVVEVIMNINCTGNPGDGKIFILPVLESYKVSDGSKEVSES